MKVTKSQIINGVIAYIEAEVIPNIPDKGFQVILGIGTSAVMSNHHIVDRYLDNDLVKSLAGYDDDTKTYDIDAITKIIRDSIDKFGYFPIKLPAINFISPVEKELKFSVTDIDKMKEYITR